MPTVLPAAAAEVLADLDEFDLTADPAALSTDVMAEERTPPREAAPADLEVAVAAEVLEELLEPPLALDIDELLPPDDQDVDPMPLLELDPVVDRRGV